jgi:ribonuclease HI
MEKNNNVVLREGPLRTIGRATNNIAEYVALIDGVRACAQLFPEEKKVSLRAFTDSELITRQFSVGLSVQVAWGLFLSVQVGMQLTHGLKAPGFNP